MPAMITLPLPSFEQQPIFLQPSRDETIGFVNDLQSQLRRFNDFYSVPKMKSSTPQNPCMKDLVRTGCKDAQCLKRHAETLSGSCAELLLRPVLHRNVPEPSPAPVARATPADMINKLLGQHELKPRPEDRRRTQQEGEAGGFFTMMTTDADGHSKTVSGPIGGATLPPELAQLTRMMPDLAGQVLPELASAFGAFAPMLLGRPMEIVVRQERPEPEGAKEEDQYPTASIGDDPADVAAAEALRGNPCADDIMACRQITGHSSAEIKQCLQAHLDELQPRCKCFFTQLDGPEKMQQSARAATAPTVGAVPVTTSRVVVLDDMPMVLTSSSEPRHPAHVAHAHASHGGPCIFMMTATFILFGLVLRQCLLCCCRAPAPAPTVAVVVPPEQTMIKLMEPLRAEDIKTVAVSK